MSCPFYLVIGTKKTSSGVFHIYAEVNEEIVDIGNVEELCQALLIQNKNQNLTPQDIVSVVLIRNSTEGGPKMIGDWA